MARGLKIVGLAVLAGLAAGAARARPLRVMSISDCGDQLVLALLPPSQIASVTWLARDPSASIMAREAMRVPVNHGAAEEVLRDRPDLVIAGTYTTPVARALLKRLHVPMLELGADQQLRRRAPPDPPGGRRGRRPRAGREADRRDGRHAGTARRAPGPAAACGRLGRRRLRRPCGLDVRRRAAGRRRAQRCCRARGPAGGGGPSIERLLAVRPDLAGGGRAGIGAPGAEIGGAGQPDGPADLGRPDRVPAGPGL